MGMHTHPLINNILLPFIHTKHTISYYLVIVLQLSLVCDLIYEEQFQFTFPSFNLI